MWKFFHEKFSRIFDDFAKNLARETKFLHSRKFTHKNFFERAIREILSCKKVLIFLSLFYFVLFVFYIGCILFSFLQTNGRFRGI